MAGFFIFYKRYNVLNNILLGESSILFPTLKPGRMIFQNIPKAILDYVSHMRPTC